jgi:hypothetical protein
VARTGFRDRERLLFHANGHSSEHQSAVSSADRLNVEISLMFAIMGVVVTKTLPGDPGTRILGVPNRWFVALAASTFCVLVELWLNRIAPSFNWWWNARTPSRIRSATSVLRDRLWVRSSDGSAEGPW